MTPVESIQIEIVQKMQDDEVWYEGERRRCPVPPNDRNVQLRICNILQAHGKAIREIATGIAIERGLIDSDDSRMVG